MITKTKYIEIKNERKIKPYKTQNLFLRFYTFSKGKKAFKWRVLGDLWRFSVVKFQATKEVIFRIISVNKIMKFNNLIRLDSLKLKFFGNLTMEVSRYD